MRLFSSTVRWVLPADFPSAILSDVVPVGVQEMTAGGWCIVAPLGSTAAALALKDRFQEMFFSLFRCHRHLGQPRSHHISSKCETRPSSRWTPGATFTTLPSDQTRPSSGSSFFFFDHVGASKVSVKKKKIVFFLVYFVCIQSWLCAAEVEQCVAHWSRMFLWLSSKLFMPNYYHHFGAGCYSHGLLLPEVHKHEGECWVTH